MRFFQMIYLLLDKDHTPEQFCIRKSSLDGFLAIFSRLLVRSDFLDPDDLSRSGPLLPESLIGLFFDFLPGRVPPIGDPLRVNTRIITNHQYTQLCTINRDGNGTYGRQEQSNSKAKPWTNNWLYQSQFCVNY